MTAMAGKLLSLYKNGHNLTIGIEGGPTRPAGLMASGTASRSTLRRSKAGDLAPAH